jgi:enolase
MTEYYYKMCNEHPLIEYIEDPFAENDVHGNQKILRKFREHMPRVKLGVKNWFKSNLDSIK